MKIKQLGHKSVSFYSHVDTNKGKIAVALKKAFDIRDLKNLLSKHVSTNWSELIDKNKFDFYKLLPASEHSNPGISGNEYQRATFNLFECYQRKFERIQLNAAAFGCYQFMITRYKKATERKSIGDVRFVSNLSQPSNLAKALNYIARKGIDSTDQLTSFINWANQLVDKKPALSNLIQKIELYIEKFGINRIINLVESRVNRIVHKEMSNPIEFVSLTYENFNQFKGGMVVLRNRVGKKGDTWNAYFMIAAIGAVDGNKIAIPIKYSPKYHGPLHHFARLNVPYTIIFEENRIRISVGYQCEREVNAYNENVVGIDLNTKHNLFCTEGLDLDFDRKLVDKSLRVFDSNCRQGKKDHYKRAIEQSIKNKIVQLADYLISIGKDHAVVEDIQKFATNFIKVDGTRINKLLAALNFGSIKTWIGQIFEKRGIQVTITPAHYTSQECNKCHHVARENRKTQELFSCVSCGHTDNADNNSNKNIANRVLSDVLRAEIFVEKEGRFYAKRLSKQMIKSAIFALSTLKDQEVIGVPIYSRSR